MQGIDPKTGLTITGAQQAAQRLRRAMTTQLGSREKRRKVGGEVRKLNGVTSEFNRMRLINRIHRILANPANDLSDIKNPVLTVSVVNAGFRIQIDFDYDNTKESVTL